MNSCTRLLVFLFAVGTFESQASAGFILNQPTDGNPNFVPVASPADHSWSAWTDTRYVQYVPSASTQMQQTLATTFPGWTFTFATGGLSGTMTINTHKATVLGNSSGGTELDAKYQRASSDPTLADLQFIQLVSTSDPLYGATSPYIDPSGGALYDDKPFYWPLDTMNSQRDQTAGTVRFYDFPVRSAPPVPGPSSRSWHGEMMMTSWSGGTSTSVTLYDGFRWGFLLRRDYSGPPGSPSLLAEGTDASPPQLTAVPEPSSLLLLLIGGPGLSAILRKRRKS